MYFDFCSFFLILPSTHTVFNFLRVLFLAFSSSLCSLLCFMHICTYMQMIRIISGNFSIILRSVLDLFPRPIFFPLIWAQAFPISSHAQDISCCVGQLLHFCFIQNTCPVLLLNRPQDGYHLFSSPSPPQSLLPHLAVLLIALFHSWFFLSFSSPTFKNE